MMMTILPLTDRCARVLDVGEHAVLGLSPFNGYYRPAVVEALVDWACNTFTAVDVLLPGYHALYTPLVGGRSPLAAARHRERAIAQLRAPALRALRRAGVPTPEQRVRTWTQLAGHPAYRALHDRARDAYQHCAPLRELCRALTAQALPGADPRDLDRYGGYIVAELPFFADSPSIYGVGSSVFVYHRAIPTLELLFTSTVPQLQLAPGQAFAAVTLTLDIRKDHDHVHPTADPTPASGDPGLATRFR